jgi:hypothetical protein
MKRVKIIWDFQADLSTVSRSNPKQTGRLDCRQARIVGSSENWIGFTNVKADLAPKITNGAW